MTTQTQTMTFTIFVNLSSHNSAWSYSDLEKVDEIQQVDLNREKVDLNREKMDLDREKVDLNREKVDLDREKVDLYREEEQMEGKAALTGLLEVVVGKNQMAGKVPLTAAVVEPKVVAGIQIS